MSKIDYWLSPEGLILLQAKSRDSLTRSELAEKVGITPMTLSRWEKKYPQIADAVRSGREIVDAKVENAMLKKALGYETTEVKTVVKANGSEEVTTVHKNVPPDVSAASVWLKNRCPDKWKDKPSEDDSGVLLKLQEILQGIDDQADE